MGSSSAEKSMKMVAEEEEDDGNPRNGGSSSNNTLEENDGKSFGSAPVQPDQDTEAPMDARSPSLLHAGGREARWIKSSDAEASPVADEREGAKHRPCQEPSPGIYNSNGFLKVSCNGGLNQMRAAICDMVTVARYSNLTLVVPELGKKSFWADPSDFGDMFDVKHFIESLADEVHIN